MDRRRAATGELATIPAVVADRARRHGARVAVVTPEEKLTYAELATEAQRVTRAMMWLGVQPEDRVAIWAPNGARWVIAALGVLGAGATLVPVSTRLRGREAAEILARSRCRMLFTVREFLGNDYPRMLRESRHTLPELRTTALLHGPTGRNHDANPHSRQRFPDRARDGIGGRFGRAHHEDLSWSGFLALATGVAVAEAEERSASVDPEAVCDILFTSGTTGVPKGVPATHRQTIETFTWWADAVTLSGDDRYLLVNPFSHTFGYKAGIIACLLRGATMVPVDRFDPEQVFALIERERITVLTGPPTLFHDLLDHDRRQAHDLRSLRLAGTGGASVPTGLVQRIRRDLGAEKVFTAYGLTESNGVVTVCPPDAPADRLAGTVGKALPGVWVRIVDAAGRPLPAGEPGQIVVRGPTVMHGYLDDPEATSAAIDSGGWLHTGDIGTLDADGYLRITDRLADMFIVGGFNAYPAEIERILLAHPDIREAAVVGVPDSRLGEVGCAFVVRNGPADIDAAEIIAWARTRMAGYKVPRRIEFVASLPRNASGKVLKRILRSSGGRS
ncbi:FadD3 family acyl-CoA ligase [Nocardia pneumoniae]|uniref:FadD3 family acyl-CoA ligase n=1 Tax=Nocardia pneumoniae TaxID=228601 RepID=UPI0002E06552|nr:FadD3 family acyl-CoA ligase [Nocardia pneumoniae]